MKDQQIAIENLHALDGFKSFKIEPYKCFYCNYKIQTEITRHCYNQEYSNMMLVCGIDLYVDNEIESNFIYYCEPGVYAKWKELKSHPWVDKNDSSIDLWKVAASLYESEKNTPKDLIDIDWTFKPPQHTK